MYRGGAGGAQSPPAVQGWRFRGKKACGTRRRVKGLGEIVDTSFQFPVASPGHVARECRPLKT